MNRVLFFTADDGSRGFELWRATAPRLARYSYTVTATLSNYTADEDVFLLAPGGCQAGQCLAGGSYGDFQAIAENVPLGTYYVAVDAYLGAAGTFTLDLTCTPSGGPSYFVYLSLAIKNR